MSEQRYGEGVPDPIHEELQVRYDSLTNLSHCECCLFESSGIMCRHIIPWCSRSSAEVCLKVVEKGHSVEAYTYQSCLS